MYMRSSYNTAWEKHVTYQTNAIASKEAARNEQRLRSSSSLKDDTKIKHNRRRQEDAHSTTEEVCHGSRSQGAEKCSEGEDRDDQGLIAWRDGGLAFVVDVSFGEAVGFVSC
jgi:hypothetical protein